MKLSTLDRIAIIAILPKEGSFLKQEMAKDIVDKINFSPEEKENLSMSAAGSLQWTVEMEKEVEFTSAERALITEALIDLDKREKIISDHLNIYRMFVLDAQHKS